MNLFYGVIKLQNIIIAWQIKQLWYYKDVNRLELLVLNKSAEVYTRYCDIPSLMAFLSRTGRPNKFAIVAHKGPKAIFIERLDPSTLIKILTEFQNQP